MVVDAEGAAAEVDLAGAAETSGPAVPTTRATSVRVVAADSMDKAIRKDSALAAEDLTDLLMDQEILVPVDRISVVPTVASDPAVPMVSVPTVGSVLVADAVGAGQVVRVVQAAAVGTLSLLH